MAYLPPLGKLSCLYALPVILSAMTEPRPKMPLTG
jgi:hypothetical protein